MAGTETSVDQSNRTENAPATGASLRGRVDSAGPADVVEAKEGILVIDDDRVRFQYTGSQDVIDLSFDQVRRVQIDFELGRPAALAIVPNSGSLDVRILTVERDQFEPLAAAMLRLAIHIERGTGG